MPSSAKPSQWPIVVTVLLGVLAVLPWVMQLSLLADLKGSDPAENAIAGAYQDSPARAAMLAKLAALRQRS